MGVRIFIDPSSPWGLSRNKFWAASSQHCKVQSWLLNSFPVDGYPNDKPPGCSVKTIIDQYLPARFNFCEPLSSIHYLDWLLKYRNYIMIYTLYPQFSCYHWYLLQRILLVKLFTPMGAPIQSSISPHFSQELMYASPTLLMDPSSLNKRRL